MNSNYNILESLTELFISFIGVSLMALEFDRGIALKPGTLIVLLAAVAHAGFFVLQRPLLKRYRPIEVSSYAIQCGHCH